MTITAGTVVNREERIRAAAMMIALAYARNLREGDHVRASVILAAFQRFWTEHRAAIVFDEAAFAGLPPDLRATGMLDQSTQNAVLYMLYVGGFIPLAIAQMTAVGASQLNTQVASYLPVMNSPAWEGYEHSRRGLPQDAGEWIGNWAAMYADGLRLQDISMDGPYDPAEEEGPPRIDPVDILLPELPVTAQTLTPRTPTLWPWVVVGAGAALLYAGFVYKKKRRGRR